MKNPPPLPDFFMKYFAGIKKLHYSGFENKRIYHCIAIGYPKIRSEDSFEHNVILIYLIRTMNYYQSEKEAYVVPRAIVFDVKVEEGFASSGEGEITPGEEDSEWGN